MAWVTTGEPTVQRQRDRWVVRVSGYDAATGRRKVRQLGTYGTKKAAVAQVKAVADGRAGSDDEVLAEYLRNVWLPAKDGRVETSTYTHVVDEQHRRAGDLIASCSQSRLDVRRCPMMPRNPTPA